MSSGAGLPLETSALSISQSLLLVSSDGSLEGSSWQDEMEVGAAGSSPLLLPDPSPHYHLRQMLGSGTYGTVVAATSLSSAPGRPHLPVAIKMISSAFRQNLLLARRTLREVALLRRLLHPNVISILDFYQGRPSGRFYLVTQLMDTDLDQIIRSDQALSDAHINFICFQVLLGLRYLHSCGICHRDLKPANILVNEDCSVRIADLGMARLMVGEQESLSSNMTEYVVSRWWRAPEVMLADHYSFELDVWSVGTIYAEMILRKPLFMGKDYADQLVKIIAILGTPPADQIARIPEQGARDFVKSLRKSERIGWDVLMPNSTQEQQAALDGMLAFEPSSRSTVSDLLRMPLFAAFLETMDEDEDPPGSLMLFEWRESELQSVDDVDNWLMKELSAADHLREERIKKDH